MPSLKGQDCILAAFRKQPNTSANLVNKDNTVCPSLTEYCTIHTSADSRASFTRLSKTQELATSDKKTSLLIQKLTELNMTLRNAVIKCPETRAFILGEKKIDELISRITGRLRIFQKQIKTETVKCKAGNTAGIQNCYLESVRIRKEQTIPFSRNRALFKK